MNEDLVLKWRENLDPAIGGIALLDRDKQSYLSSGCEALDSHTFLEYRWRKPPVTSADEFWVGLISYDDAAQKIVTERSKFWRVSFQAIHDAPTSLSTTNSKPWQWSYEDKDTDYLRQVGEVIEEIAEGNFYQLNLCRYLSTDRHYSEVEILQRLRHYGGPHSAWVIDRDFELVSFSPEEFIRIDPSTDGHLVTTRPIKGTAPRSSDSSKDEVNRQQLEQSKKDRAELTMIIDLMRNDMLHVCDFGSVDVLSAGKIESFANVHHLVGEIRGKLCGHIAMQDIVTHLCPSGSITGAPKRAVMETIRKYEKRDRGFFMGNLLVLEPKTGQLRSSVLIRTMARHRDEFFEFGVGSGIVIKSQPELERQELCAKARVVWDF